MITAREQQPEPASAAMLTRAPGQRLPDLLVRYFPLGGIKESWPAGSTRRPIPLPSRPDVP
jgi:hypothetical protein